MSQNKVTKIVMIELCIIDFYTLERIRETVKICRFTRIGFGILFVTLNF